MKKQNRNAFAYIRQPNVQQNDDPFSGTKTAKQSPNQSMFNQIVGQMDGNFTSYLGKLMSKNQKQQQKKRKTIQKSLNHERTKSYADIQVETPSNSKNPPEKGHSYRGSHPSTQINNIFFSVNNSPTSQKPEKPEANIQKKNAEKNTRPSSFLENLDNYIMDLSLNRSFGSRKHEKMFEQSTADRKSLQKTRENSASNLKIIQKLQSSLRRQKQLKVANQILASENEKLKKKLRNSKTLKTSLWDMYRFAREIQSQLTHQKRQKRKLEQFIGQFQEKFTMLRPQRKTSGGRTKIEDYQLSETTEQDDQESAQFFPSEHSKSIKRRTALPRSTAKNSRISGFNMESLSAMLASKEFGFEDQSSSNQEI